MIKKKEQKSTKKFSKKKRNFQKKSFKIVAEEFLKSFRKKIFLRRLPTLRIDFQALI
jgi:hypothetical protein